ncbi:universal stress protein [Desulforamulus ruminis]|uniref:UspA domain-containing protein n=1 Tax=Desulforamulus ruminis (strain ATCC 23193 / DSM 2154 / NCIMB 8452 / DL) TaxID=696281 RepID=F6DVC8_DESRL|nr:universal stress protein [Desulforamulus ruminis]AEG60281.1 hypothetical protein Desru_2027 [Desulforamulus ruminis DSM 2154]
MRKRITIITDESGPAVEAVDMAMKLARSQELPVSVVFILDEGMRYLLGDEWMSTAEARTSFFQWLEKEQKDQIQQTMTCYTQKATEQGIEITAKVLVGKPERIIIETGNHPETAFMVIPNPHAKTSRLAGFQYNLHSMAKKVRCPLLIGPA